ncbi:MAG: hypothetical protein ACOY41_05920 [Pseudomonadota bacterium]
MRPVLILLLLPLTLHAAEPIEGQALEETYIPSLPDCPESDRRRDSGGCPADVEPKAIREAEDQASGRDALTRAIPEVQLPGPRELPAAELTPPQLQIAEDIKNIAAPNLR